MGEAEKEREKGSHENFILLCYLYSKMGTCDIDKVHGIDTIERKAIDDSDPWVYLVFLISKYLKKKFRSILIGVKHFRMCTKRFEISILKNYDLIYGNFDENA